jgi:putative transposase
MFGAMTRASERWRSIRVSEFERRQMTALRQELDHDYEAAVVLDPTRSKPVLATKIPSRSRT